MQPPANAGTLLPETVPLPQETASEAKTGPLGAVPQPSQGDDSLITLHADELDVRKVLEMLSRQGNVGMALSPSVTGKITLDIRNKTLDEALTIIAGLCHLTVRRENDVIYISTPGEVRQAQEANLPVRIYHLNYVKSSEVMNMIKDLKSPKGKITASPDSQTGLQSGSVGGGSSGGSGGGSSGGGGGGGGGGSTGGNALAGGEVLIVQDYEEVLKKIDRVIAELDVQPAQVMIEAVILEVDLTKDLDLGASFAVMDNAGKTLGTVGSADVHQRRGRILAGFGRNLGREDGRRVRRRH